MAGKENVFSASHPQRVDFPQAGTQLQFFYVQPKNPDDGLMLAGCLHYTDAQGRLRISSKTFYSEGGRAPVITVLFNTQLEKGWVTHCS